MATASEQSVGGWQPLDLAGAQPVVPFGAAPIGGPPVFQRPPRDYAMPPQGEVEVQAPPPAPAVPSSSPATLVLSLLPGLVTVLAGVLLTVFAAGSGQSNILFLSLPLLLAALPLSIYSYDRERRTYRRAAAQREQDYRAYLGARRQSLAMLQEQQRQASRVVHPTPAECRGRAERRDSRLWERQPADADFLDLRLGSGSAPTLFAVKPPAMPPATLQVEPLLQEALALAAGSSRVDDVAVTLPLRRVGTAGLAGPGALVRDTVRALLLQLATHHTPSDVKLVLTFPEADREEWAWARWLPHTWRDDRQRRFVAATPESAYRLLEELGKTLDARQLQQRANGENTPLAGPAYVFVFADPDLLHGLQAGKVAPLLHLLLTRGASLGAYALFLADRREGVPQACGAIVDLTRGSKRLELVGPPPVERVFAPDAVDTPTADHFARTLAPLRLGGAAGAHQLPPSVPLLNLLGANRVEDLPVTERWQRSKPFESLAVPIGVRPGGEALRLDLHQSTAYGHGPHGLVAGMTGSGKSELLLSLIASLAAHFDPREVVFVLLDFKEGGMLNQIRDLPHLVNGITNLEMGDVPRAIRSLDAERVRRAEIFKRAGEKLDRPDLDDLDEYMPLYRQGQVEECIPYLILVVDEFTALKNELPDDMATFVNVATRGRNTGFRMILATQKPAGVVSAQIDVNTKFRLCLRVAQPEDSSEMIRRPDAANLTRAGRAYLRVGQDEVFELFQSAWSGAPYTPDTQVSSTVGEAVAVELDGTPRRLSSSAGTARASHDGQAQLRALVSHLRDMAERQGIERLPGPWRPPLPPTLSLGALRGDGAAGWDGQIWRPAGEWLAPIVGLVDDPARQAQGPLRMHLGTEGHLAIYGAPGSGKTTFLQTLVTSLALEHSPKELWLYLLDFGGRLLTLFESLPHVGAVILPDEVERLNRLIRMLLDELGSRKKLFSRAGIGTLHAYRAQAAEAPPAVVVVLDNFAGFNESYPDLIDVLVRLANEGGNYGIHLVLTGTAIPSRLIGYFAQALALQLNDSADYSILVGRPSRWVRTPSVPGRGLVRATPPLEFQTALPVAGTTEAERAAALKSLLATMAATWKGPVAPPAAPVPDLIALSSLLPPADAWDRDHNQSLAVPLGVDATTQEPLVVDLAAGPHFLVTGPPARGKTTLLQSWLLALAERFPPARVQFYSVSFGSPLLLPLAQLPHTAAYVEDDARLGEVAQDLDRALIERQQALDEARRAAGGILDERSFLARYPTLVMAIDDFDQFKVGVSSTNQAMLETVIRRGRRLGFHLLLAGPSSDFTSAYDPVGKAVKEGQTGFLVGSSDYDELSIFNIRLPSAETGKFLPPGRSYLAQRGRPPRLAQIATCHTGTPSLADWIGLIKQKQTRKAGGSAPGGE